MFKETKTGVVSGKKDGLGKVAIRIDLQNPNHDETTGTPVLPASGNLREVVFVEEAKVSEVTAAIRKALFGE